MGALLCSYSRCKRALLTRLVGIRTFLLRLYFSTLAIDALYRCSTNRTCGSFAWRRWSTYPLLPIACLQSTPCTDVQLFEHVEFLHGDDSLHICCCPWLSIFHSNLAPRYRLERAHFLFGEDVWTL